MNDEARQILADINANIIHIIYITKGIISPEMYERWLAIERGE